MKSTREQVNIIHAYRDSGSSRAAGRLCGLSDITVERVLERQQAGGPWRRPPRTVPKGDPEAAQPWAAVRWREEAFAMTIA